ncbi:MAG: hypothetical protein RM338_24570 [Nostoc sp. DedQUE12a]|nr:hypothetical protein [Nostoc sp. DedQUE12a]
MIEADAGTRRHKDAGIFYYFRRWFLNHRLYNNQSFAETAIYRV